MGARGGGGQRVRRAGAASGGVEGTDYRLAAATASQPLQMNAN
jgi:hypothetical protein